MISTWGAKEEAKPNWNRQAAAQISALENQPAKPFQLWWPLFKLLDLQVWPILVRGVKIKIKINFRFSLFCFLFFRLFFKLYSRVVLILPVLRERSRKSSLLQLPSHVTSHIATFMEVNLEKFSSSFSKLVLSLDNDIAAFRFCLLEPLRTTKVALYLPLFFATKMCH